MRSIGSSRTTEVSYTTSDTRSSRRLTRNGSDDDDQYLPCPEGCGEHVLWSELQVHLDLHFAENLPSDETFFEDMYAPYFVPQYNLCLTRSYQGGFYYDRYSRHFYGIPVSTSPAYSYTSYLATTAHWTRESIAAWLAS